jgi:hypothetical protein
MMDLAGCGSDKIRNVQVIGNIGLRNGCTAGVTYRYNVYSNTGTCDPTERYIGAGGGIPFYASDTHVPEAESYKLSGASSADNLVPASVGCPATDRFGAARGTAGFCDTGAHER